MARTKINGVERPCTIKRSRLAQVESEESDKEEPMMKKVFKKKSLYYVRELVPDDTDILSGQPAEGNNNISVGLKEIIRLETVEEGLMRKAAYAYNKRIKEMLKADFWRNTVHPMVVVRSQVTGLNKSQQYAVCPNCYLGLKPYERSVTYPQVFVSCIEVRRRNVTGQKKVYIVIGMLVDLFSRPNMTVLLHSIIMHQDSTR